MIEITREMFDQQWRPRFGNANPERMHVPFWEWMIRGEPISVPMRHGIPGPHGFVLRGGSLLKETCYGPWQARELFEVFDDRQNGPIWTFQRMGATQTELPDGRLVCIGGEHEDYYDSDFCIYNDVITFTSPDEFELYGYPKEVFPPTDFHTATLHSERIVIVGGLGYPEDRLFGETPVHVLDISTLKMSRMATSGQAPGWIFNHEAELDRNGRLFVRQGETYWDKNEYSRRNIEDYGLDLNSGEWRRLTDRRWPQFVIRMETAEMFPLDIDPELEVLLPHGATTPVNSDDTPSVSRFEVEGVPVQITRGAYEITIIVETEPTKDLAVRLAEEIHRNNEAAIKQRCVLERRS